MTVEQYAQAICALEVKHRRGRPWHALTDEEQARRIKHAAGLMRCYAAAGNAPSKGGL